MSWILIFVGLSLADPTGKAFLAHQAFKTQTECNYAAQEALKEVPVGSRGIIFCVAESDLTEK